MRPGVYQIINKVNGKRYIGSSIKVLRRLKYHKRALRSGKHYNLYLQRAWDKYGEVYFEFQVLLYCDETSLLFYEQRAINVFKSSNGGGFNAKPTAENSLGFKHSEATKRKISESEKGKTISAETIQKLGKTFFPKGITPWNKGRTGVYSDETRQRISQSLKGTTLPTATREKISEALRGEKNPFYGRAHTEESKQKMSKSKKGCPATFAGMKHTEESKRKMSETKRKNHHNTPGQPGDEE